MAPVRRFARQRVYPIGAALLLASSTTPAQDAPSLSAGSAGGILAIAGNLEIAVGPPHHADEAERAPPPENVSQEVRLLDDRLSLNFRADHGRDLRNSRRVLTSRQLNQNTNWRREAAFDFELPDSDLLSIGLAGGVFDARRPSRNAREELELGEVVSWRVHEAMDASLDLALLGDRLRYEASYAQSDYEGEIDERAARRRKRDRRALPPSRERTGEAHTHRIEADIVETGAVELSAHGRYGVIDPGYRPSPGSRRHAADTGENRELGASIGLDPARLDLSLLEHADRRNRLQKIGGTVTYGSVELGLSHEVFTRDDDQGNRLWREHALDAELELGLEDHRGTFADDGGSRAWRLLPSSLSLSAGYGRTRHARAPDDPRDVETGLGLGLYWDWGGLADTSLLAYRTLYDSHSSATASSEDHYLEVSQGFYAERWDFSLYSWFGHYDADHRSIDMFYGGGISFSARPQSLPALSTAFDVDRFYSQDSTTGEYFGDRTFEFDLEFDLSPYLESMIAHDDPMVRLYYHAKRTEFSDVYFGEWVETAHAVGMTLDLRF